MAKENEKKRVSRGMPNNTEAEASVLGAVLIDDNAAGVLVPMLNADDFYLAANRTIFGVMKEMQAVNDPIDILTVADKLELIGKLDEIGSVAYLSELAEGVVSAANGEYYADIVKRDSLIRRVIHAGNEIAKSGYDSTDGKEALANAERLVYKLSEENSEKALVLADKAFAKVMNDIEDAQKGNVSKRVVLTGFERFDRKSRGLKPGELVLIAARPSVGKTAFALNIAVNVATNKADPKAVAIFSLEMPAELLAKRMLSYLSGVSLSKMDTRGGLDRGDAHKTLFNAFQLLSAKNIYIDDYSMNGPADVLSKCRRLKREKGLDLVIIDYLQLMTSVGPNGRAPESRQVEVSDMSRKMKIYAKELDCPIILLSQMSRGIEQRNDHTPLLSDLRESGSIEQDADIVTFLYNPSRYNAALPENQVILDVKKNRNGPIGGIMLEWTGETTTFREIGELDAQAGEKDKPSEVSVIDQIRSEVEQKTEVTEINDELPFEVGSESPSDLGLAAADNAENPYEQPEDEYDDDLDDEDGDLPF